MDHELLAYAVSHSTEEDAVLAEFGENVANCADPTDA